MAFSDFSAACAPQLSSWIVPGKRHARLWQPISTARAQRGAVLYVSLVLLILLALIGVAGMQVSGMQERMSSAYRATNLAFQNAEAVARKKEAEISTALGPDSASGSFVSDQELCSAGFDPAAWAEDLGDSVTDSVRTRRIDQCSPGGSLSMGQRPLSEDTNLVYQISAYSTDTSASAQAVIDTVFIP